MIFYIDEYSDFQDLLDAIEEHHVQIRHITITGIKFHHYAQEIVNVLLDHHPIIHIHFDFPVQVRGTSNRPHFEQVSEITDTTGKSLYITK